MKTRTTTTKKPVKASTPKTHAQTYVKTIAKADIEGRLLKARELVLLMGAAPHCSSPHHDMAGALEATSRDVIERLDDVIALVLKSPTWALGER